MFKKETRPTHMPGVTGLGRWENKTEDDPRIEEILEVGEVVLTSEEHDLWGRRKVKNGFLPIWGGSTDQINEVVIVTTSLRRIIVIRGQERETPGIGNGEDDRSLGMFAECSEKSFELIHQQLKL